MPAKLKITQTRSISGRIQKHRRTIEALGLKRMHHSVVHNDTPQIRGMIRAVSFMIKVEEV
ncbi:MAG: 50S ribosomal protein L30 [candidate division Zixibacteria bacterium]|nr:50S ribosomal protein L30 [candidate division Zixibacteria bacterium]